MRRGSNRSFRIIVRVLNWLGDAVLCTPALTTLRRRFPQASLSVLAHKRVEEVFYYNSTIDDMITFSDVEGYWSIARKLRRKKFDLGIIFPYSFSSALIFFLARIPDRVGYATQGRSLLLTRRIELNPSFRKEHQVMYYLNLVRQMTQGRDQKSEVESKKLVWNVTEDERTRAEELLREVGISQQDRLIGMNPGATYGPAKRWFPDRFAKVGDEIVKRYGARIIIFGNSQERRIANSIANMMQKMPVNFAGRTNLRELAAMISRCQVFVTNDTGSMHIAAAVGTPVAAIFGSTNPQKSAPWGDGHIVTRKEIECSPCMKKICPRRHYKCMEIIEVQEVLKAIEQQFQKIGGQNKDGKAYEGMAL
ncbi:lipopolysaccharide heptosyltransferase II [candidate division NPL-UPA2 bacterium]|nr:lipopolysaccharide heptosyltransferase II [candidate division NPL-UPA2 bacterium]